jgi:hypothetical protein
VAARLRIEPDESDISELQRGERVVLVLPLESVRVGEQIRVVRGATVAHGKQLWIELEAGNQGTCSKLNVSPDSVCKSSSGDTIPNSKTDSNSGHVTDRTACSGDTIQNSQTDSNSGHVPDRTGDYVTRWLARYLLHAGD